MLHRRLARLLAVAVVPASLVYLLVLFVAAAAGIEPGLVLSDLMQTCDEPIGVGMISNLGILLWAAAAAIGLFASMSGLILQKKWRQLLRLGGIFSAILCLDDFFLLHDRHISPDVLYLCYAVFTVIVLVYFRQLILQVDGVAFLAAAIFLGSAVLIDQFQPLQEQSPNLYATVQLFEEGFKFIGIACWLTFWSQAARYGLKLQNLESS